MAFVIEESFQVPASPDLVWAYLVDPKRVVECLPGAELLEADGSTFRGRMKVSVGPVTVAYEGTAAFLELDEGARRVRLEARGQEAAGPGSARLTMESTVGAGPDGAAEIRVRATIDVAGKIVQFGRGMIQTVSKELFRQFGDCARSALERASAERAGPPATHRPPVGSPPEKKPLRPLRLLLSALPAKLKAIFRR